MHEFLGAVLGSEHDPALPTVAHIDGKCLILSSPEGLVEEWPLDRVQIIEVGNGISRWFPTTAHSPWSSTSPKPSERHSTRKGPTARRHRK